MVYCYSLLVTKYPVYLYVPPPLWMGWFINYRLGHMCIYVLNSNRTNVCVSSVSVLSCSWTQRFEHMHVSSSSLYLFIHYKNLMYRRYSVLEGFFQILKIAQLI